ncbi:MAG: Hpt domain-containing protein, partial [Steroidobacteraceae bacterium]
GPSLASPPLDLARLASLAAEDVSFMRELLSAFRASAAGALEEMRDAQVSDRRDRLQRAAHKLKGASDNIGAGRLRDLAFELESRASEAPPGQLAQWIDAVAAELAELDGFFSTTDLAALARRQAS